MTHFKSIFFVLTISSLINCSASLEEMPLEGSVDSGVVLGTPTMHMRGKIIHKIGFGVDPKFDAQGGTVQVKFFDPAGLPDDLRPRINLDNGQFCTFEVVTEWPEVLGPDPDNPNENIIWPSTSHQGGNATINFESGPGPVALEQFETIYQPTSPDPVPSGSSGTHNAFFDGSYLPPGADFEMSFTAGTDVGAFSFSSSVPSDFEVTKPGLTDPEVVVDVAKDMDLEWTPGQSDTKMVVLMRTGFPYIKCELDDDGSATIPAAAMLQLTGSNITPMNIQFLREKRITTQVNDSNGDVIQIDFTNRTNKYTKFTRTTDSSL